MKITTPRLLLRHLSSSDSHSIQSGMNDLHISKWLSAVKYPYTINDAKKWLRQVKRYNSQKEITDVVFGLELKSEKRIIGVIGIHSIDTRTGCAKIGYWLSRKHHDNGYASEAMTEVLKYAFHKLKINRLEAGVFAGNKASAGLLEKFNFQKEGLKREADRCLATGKLQNTTLYALLRKDYKSLKQRK